MTNEQRKMNPIARITLFILGGLGAFGMIGTLIMIIRDTGKVPPRPDFCLNDKIAALAPDGKLCVLVSRYKNRVYDRQWGEGVDGNTPFPIGALADQFTAMGIMILNEEKKLDYDAPIETVLPGLPEELRQVTSRQLLTHTSGIPVTITRLDSPFASPIKPGTRSEYSPLNYHLLGLIFAQVTGQPAETYIQERLIARLQPEPMEHTFFEKNEQFPDGVWYASGEDLMRWEQALRTNQFVRFPRLKEATTAASLGEEERGEFGFAWSIDEYRGLRVEQATGTAFTNACITRFAEKNFAAVILSDQPLSELDVRALGREIGACYLDREMRY